MSGEKRTEEIQEKAFAKINLSLDILSRREDGYHDLRMVMQTVSLWDTLFLRRAEGIQLSCGESPLPCDSRNTVWRAAEAFLQETGFPGLSIRLEKRIPSQAGLGGGSADAAAVLRGANALYGAGLSPERLCSLGKQVGADVPFCIRGGTALAEGIGDRLTPLPGIPRCRIVIGKPETGVSTAEAYKKADEPGRREKRYTERLLRAMKSGMLPELARALGNDFQDFLCIPESECIRKAMLDQGALGALMTGSGSAVYGLFSPDSGQAEECVRQLELCGIPVFLCDPVSSFLCV